MKSLSFILIALLHCTPIAAFNNQKLTQHPRHDDFTKKKIPFRAILQGLGRPEDETFYDKSAWQKVIAKWKQEGYNAVVWYGPGELTNGEHMLIRHVKYPEAREISAEENEKIIAQMNWLFNAAARHGLKNILQTQSIFFTSAYAKSHGLDTISVISPESGKWHRNGYPNFWPGKGKEGKVYNCDIRNALTMAYTTAVYEELLQTYPQLSGFMCYSGEPLPGDRSTFFKQAILPALKSSKRQPIFIANQWQIPLDGFKKNVAPQEEYNNTWLGFHGYNSEQITDAKPYPGVVNWSEETNLPTVVEIYPANQLYFPFNSPRFAYEIANEIKKEPGFRGFVYWERYIAGTLLGPLFRQALAYYSTHKGPYNEKLWIDALTEKYGDREAATHLLRAYDIAGRIIPEKDALIYSGGDVLRKELRIPYNWFTEDWPWDKTTSPARGGTLISVKQYARFVAKYPNEFTNNNGDDAGRFPYYQEAVWNSEGGSVYDVTPVEQMKKISRMGLNSLQEADTAILTVKSNQKEAEHVRDIMKAYMLLSQYYEMKVSAAIYALAYAETHKDTDKTKAVKFADIALEKYSDFIGFAIKNIDPYYTQLSGSPVTEAGLSLDKLLDLEKKERIDLPVIFKW